MGCVPISFPTASAGPEGHSHSSAFLPFVFRIQLVTSPITSASHFSHLSPPPQACHRPYLIQCSSSLTCLYSGLLTGLPAVHLLQSLQPALSQSLLLKESGLQIFSLIFRALPKLFSICFVYSSPASTLTLQPDRKLFVVSQM